MSSATSLDFTKIETWKSLSLEKTCLRVSAISEGSSYNLGALRVSTRVFSMMKEEARRSQFFLNCEILKLKHWKLFAAYNHCEENYETLIDCVLRSDKAMMQALSEQEEQRRWK